MAGSVPRNATRAASGGLLDQSRGRFLPVILTKVRTQSNVVLPYAIVSPDWMTTGGASMHLCTCHCFGVYLMPRSNLGFLR